MIKIRKAQEKDLIKIFKIYDNSIEYFKNNGIDQWQNGYPNMKTAEKDLENGALYVAEDDEIIVGTAVIYVGEEPTYKKIYNGNWLTQNSQYGIIHRIAVDNSSKQKGIASMFVDFCARLSKEKSVTSLRCDTHKDNIAMQKTLIKNNYIYCGEIILADNSPRVAFEKII